MHVVYRFDVGGLENGIVNLINNMACDKYRHVVVSLTEVTEFKDRILRDDVVFYALNKGPGHAFSLYPQLFCLFRKLSPAIVHTRNLAALEASIPAWLAGVSVRIHGEHGRDVGDLEGNNSKYQWIRRVYAPFVSHYVALSRDLSFYLKEKVHIAYTKVTQIYNGVDSSLFIPSLSDRRPLVEKCPFTEDSLWIVGTVGRMQTVKDQVTLTLAFIHALKLAPELRTCARLVLVGEGPLRLQCVDILTGAGMTHLAWLPGERDDVADIMRALDCFVLPSLAEGISNTILEAMSSGLPVIATDVGGNSDLVLDEVTGYIVPAGDMEAMANRLVRLATSSELSRSMGKAGRDRILEKFSLNTMVSTYEGLYDRLLGLVKNTVQQSSTN